AARDMIAQQFPAATAAADVLLNTTLSGIADSELKARGIQTGKEAVAALLEKRQGDFALGFAAHTGGTAPGEHQSNYMPFGVVYAPNMGELTPFGALSGDQFRDEDQYSLDSEEYLADYNEVKSLGCTACPMRTAEQTEIGAFWIESSASSMNRLARTLIVQEDLDGWEAARLIGLIQMAQIDA